MKGRTPPGADGEGAVTRTVAIDVTDARRRYRAELEVALAYAGGKTRKRTFTRMVQEVPEHRGGELVDPDETVLVWSDLHLGHANIIEYQDWPFLDVADQDAELWKAMGAHRPRRGAGRRRRRRNERSGVQGAYVSPAVLSDFDLHPRAPLGPSPCPAIALAHRRYRAQS